MTQEEAFAIPREAVESSNVAEIGYAGGRLVVLFRGGGLYVYDGVREQLYADLQVAPSKGRWLQRFVVGNKRFPFEKFTIKEQKEA